MLPLFQLLLHLMELTGKRVHVITAISRAVELFEAHLFAAPVTGSLRRGRSTAGLQESIAASRATTAAVAVAAVARLVLPLQGRQGWWIC